MDIFKYLTAVGAVTYLTTHTRPNIVFATSVLAKHSHNPTMKHWNGIKHLLRYMRGTTNLRLYYHKTDNPESHLASVLYTWEVTHDDFLFTTLCIVGNQTMT